MMKQLPDKFQFRDKDLPGYTHTATLHDYGDYKVKWARGWAQVIGVIPDSVIDKNNVKCWVENGCWIIVNDTPKQKEASLPDEFYIEVPRGAIYKFVAIDECTFMCHALDGSKETAPWSYNDISAYIKSKVWKIVDKKPLTTEQQRTLKEFKEQIAQLDSSIKLNEQDIEHRNRLIGNYKARQNDLRKKIEALQASALEGV
jgi:hypothetical protein